MHYDIKQGGEDRLHWKVIFYPRPGEIRELVMWLSGRRNFQAEGIVSGVEKCERERCRSSSRKWPISERYRLGHMSRRALQITVITVFL